MEYFVVDLHHSKALARNHGYSHLGRRVHFRDAVLAESQVSDDVGDDLRPPRYSLEAFQGAVIPGMVLEIVEEE